MSNWRLIFSSATNEKSLENIAPAIADSLDDQYGTGFVYWGGTYSHGNYLAVGEGPIWSGGYNGHTGFLRYYAVSAEVAAYLDECDCRGGVGGLRLRVPVYFS